VARSLRCVVSSEISVVQLLGRHIEIFCVIRKSQE
jgi:hypothetical protein